MGPERLQLGHVTSIESAFRGAGPENVHILHTVWLHVVNQKG